MWLLRQPDIQLLMLILRLWTTCWTSKKLVIKKLLQIGTHFQLADLLTKVVTFHQFSALLSKMSVINIKFHIKRSIRRKRKKLQVVYNTVAKLCVALVCVLYPCHNSQACHPLIHVYQFFLETSFFIIITLCSLFMSQNHVIH